jgi:hypothetical protein
MQLISGKNWRIFYWSLNIGVMRRNMMAVEKKKVGDLYGSLPDSIWFDRNVAQHV